MTVLPPDAERYLVRMRSLDPPAELVDGIMAEVEATPQVRSGPDLRATSAFVLAAAAVLLAIAVLLRLGVPDVGPSPTPVPLDQLPSAGQLRAPISIDAGDVPAAFGHGFLWLTNAATGELVRMDPANGSIASPLVITGAGSAVPIALTDTSVWVADRRDGTLVELDPGSLEERRRVPVSVSVTAMATDGSDLWLLDREANEVVRVDATDVSVGVTVSIAGSALLAYAGSVWIADDAGALVRVDPASGEETGRVDVGFAATQLVGNADSLLVVGQAGDRVVAVQIGSMQVTARGATAVAVAAQEGRVWAVVASGHLLRLDPATVEPVAASVLELETSGTLAIGAGFVWTTGVDATGDAYLLQLVPEP